MFICYIIVYVFNNTVIILLVQLIEELTVEKNNINIFTWIARVHHDSSHLSSPTLLYQSGAQGASWNTPVTADIDTKTTILENMSLV